MRIQSFALLASATAAIAAETVTLFLPGFDEQRIEGKVIGSVCAIIPFFIQHRRLILTLFQSGSMTKYLINCPADVDSDDCGLPPAGMTVNQGSSTVSLGYNMDDV